MAMVTDPVCGMQIDESEAAATLEYEGKKYHFCSKNCKEAFESDPGEYVDDD